MAWLWWLSGALALGVIELLTVDLIFLMFAGGALAGGGVALMGGPFWAQVLAFAAVSALLLWALRPWALAHLKRSTPDTVTNVAAHVGRRAEVRSEERRVGQQSRGQPYARPSQLVA